MHLARMGVFYGSIIEISLSSMALVQYFCVVVLVLGSLAVPARSKLAVERRILWLNMLATLLCRFL